MREEARQTSVMSAENKAAAASAPPAAPKRRLSYKEQQELKALPATIDRLERQIAELHDEMSQDAFYRQPRDQISAKQARLKELEDQLTGAFDRWSELEGEE